jgi:hypothetical protein
MSHTEVPSHLKRRSVGLVFILVGLCVGAWVAYDARSSRFFSLRPCLSTVAVAMGIWVVIEAPKLPVRELSPLGHVFAGVATVLALVFTWYVMGYIPFIP